MLPQRAQHDKDGLLSQTCLELKASTLFGEGGLGLLAHCFLRNQLSGRVQCNLPARSFPHQVLV
jgi:glucan phosphorylase